MSFLPLTPRKTYVLLFERLESPELKQLPGFNHMALAWIVNDTYAFVIEPTLQGANVDIVSVNEIAKSDVITALIVDLKHNRTQKLFREDFQTCATMVQYLCGIDLGATLVQTLYDRLTTKPESYLRKHGILGVRKWEPKPLEPELR